MSAQWLCKVEAGEDKAVNERFVAEEKVRKVPGTVISQCSLSKAWPKLKPPPIFADDYAASLRSASELLTRRCRFSVAGHLDASGRAK